MDITPAMLRAAGSAEFQFFLRNRGCHDRFAPIGDNLLLAIVDAAVGAIGLDDDTVPEPVLEEPEGPEEPRSPRKARVVVARKPKPRS